MTTVIPHRHNIPLPQPASQPITWRQILGLPVTWAATKRARSCLPPKSPPRPPIARAHVRAHPHPTWGLRRRCRRRRRLQPTPSRHSALNPGPKADGAPGSLLLLHSPYSMSGPHHVPRVTAHLSCPAGRRGPLREAPPPWPFSAPATALARVAAAGSSTAAPRRFQVGPRLPLLPLPAAPAAPSGPLLSPRWDGRAAAAAGALTTPPAGNRGRCSAGGLGAAEVRPRGRPSPLQEGRSSEGGTQFIPCNSLTWPFLAFVEERRRCSPAVGSPLHPALCGLLKNLYTLAPLAVWSQLYMDIIYAPASFISNHTTPNSPLWLSGCSTTRRLCSVQDFRLAFASD